MKSLSSLLSTLTLATVVAWPFVHAPAVRAQEPTATIREIAALRAELQQLRAEVEALKAAAGGTAAPATAPAEMLQAQVAELAQVKVESASRLPVRLVGAVHAGFFANSGTVNWLDLPNLATAAPADGHAGTTSASLRQTRIGFTADGPGLGAARTSAVAVMDFFGGIPAFQTGQVMGLPRLLVAYARIDGARAAMEIGQDHMILAPRDPTSLAASAFPLLFRSGNLYLRVPQVRGELAFGDRLRATAGLVAPVAGDLTGDAYVFVPPALGGERSRRPGVQARLAYTAGEAGTPRALDVGVSGHAGWERRGDLVDRSWAAAIDLSARRGWLGAAGEIFSGDNVDAFGGGLGLDAPAAGGWGELQFFPSTRASFTAGAGVDDIRDSRRFVLSRTRNRSAFGGVFFSITPELQTSVEYRWLQTSLAGGRRANHHFDWVFIHRF